MHRQVAENTDRIDLKKLDRLLEVGDTHIGGEHLRSWVVCERSRFILLFIELDKLLLRTIAGDSSELLFWLGQLRCSSNFKNIVLMTLMRKYRKKTKHLK